MEVVHGQTFFEDPGFTTAREMLERHFQNRPQDPAIRYRITPQSETLTVTYGQLEQDIKALQHAFIELGLKDKRLAIVGDNSYVWMLSYLAQVMGIGLVVPLDRLLPTDELLNLLERGKCDAIVYDMSFHSTLYKERRHDTPVTHWIAARPDRARHNEVEMFDLDTGAGAEGLHLFSDLLVRGHELLAAQGDPEVNALDPDADMSLLFTSGTSAASKAVILTHRSVTSDIRAMMMMIDFPKDLKTLSILPLHHSFENTCGFQTTLGIGGCVHIYDGLRYISQNMKEYGPDLVVGVPTIFRLIHKRILSGIAKQGKEKQFKRGVRLARFLLFFGIDVRNKLFKDIRAELGGNLYIGITGAAPIEPVIQQFYHDIGIYMIQGYGMTECSPVITGSNEKGNRFGSVGHPLPLVSIAIDNENPGEPGEVLVKSPIVMKGYYEDEEANEEAFTEDGWFKTGDVGYIRHKEYLYLSGRSKSMIVMPSGKKVFPEELEELLKVSDLVKDSMVFGQEGENGEIILTAKIVLDEEELKAMNPALTDDDEAIKKQMDELIESVNRQVPQFKGIRSYFYSFKDMVSTTTMKVKRHDEQSRLQEFMDRTKLKWYELSGKNIDKMENPDSDNTSEETAEQ